MKYDIAIVGSGFAGSIVAAIGRRLGLDVVMIEKSRHPRFVIGESTTPLANLMLEDLAGLYDLPVLKDLSKWGIWQRSHPDIGCGLKRGFSFYHHEFDRPFQQLDDRSNQLLVGASPHDRIADTHWYRPDFDRFLVERAQQAGVDYLDEVQLEPPDFADDEVVLSGTGPDGKVSVRARFLIDASGQRGFLYHSLNLPDVPLERFPPTQGLYTQFEGVRRLEDMGIAANGEAPPYPIDDAAMHHVFDGGWIWVLHFNNGITSAGVSATDEVAERFRFSDGAAAWSRLLQHLPTVAEQFEPARPILPFVHAQRLSFRSGRIAGPRWALLPSAAGFVDPLLSMGFALTLVGVTRMAQCLDRSWGKEEFVQELHTYAAQTEIDFLVAERLIAALYVNADDFELFSTLSLLYFAAVTHAEASWRLGRPRLADGWLLHRHPQFGPEAKACTETAMRPLTRDERAALLDRVYATVELIDVAGLSRRERRHWYPVEAADLLAAAEKLGATASEIEEMLERTGFFVVEN